MSVSDRVGRRGLSDSPRLERLLMAAVGVAVFGMVGRELTTPRAPDVVALVITGAAFLLCFAVEWLPIALLGLGVASFAYAGALPELHGTHITELILVLLVVMAFLHRWPAPRGREPRRVSIGMSVFVAAQFVGIAVGLKNGASLTDIAHGFRPVIYWAAYWPIAAFLLSRSKSRTHLIRIAATLTFASVGLQVLQVSGVFGSHHLFLTEPHDNTITMQAGFLRVRPPGLTLVYIVGIFAIAYLLWGPRRRRALPISLALASLLGIALSLNRNMLLGLFLGVAAAFVILPGRFRVLALFAVGATLAVLAYSTLGNTPSGTGTVGSVAGRFASIGDYSGLKTDTLNDRFYENQKAIETLRKDPIFGIGWGTSYGAMLTTYQSGNLVNTRRDFIHQQYLGVWLRMGFAGLGALLLVLLVAFRRAASIARADEASERWIAAGAVMAIVAVASGAWVAIYFFEPGSILGIVGLIALVMTMEVNQLQKYRLGPVPERAT